MTAVPILTQCHSNSVRTTIVKYDTVLFWARTPGASVQPSMDKRRAAITPLRVNRTEPT